MGYVDSMQQEFELSYPTAEDQRIAAEKEVSRLEVRYDERARFVALLSRDLRFLHKALERLDFEIARIPLKRIQHVASANPDGFPIEVLCALLEAEFECSECSEAAKRIIRIMDRERRRLAHGMPSCSIELSEIVAAYLDWKNGTKGMHSESVYGAWVSIGFALLGKPRTLSVDFGEA